MLVFSTIVALQHSGSCLLQLSDVTGQQMTSLQFRLHIKVLRLWLWKIMRVGVIGLSDYIRDTLTHQTPQHIILALLSCQTKCNERGKKEQCVFKSMPRILITLITYHCETFVLTLPSRVFSWDSSGLGSKMYGWILVWNHKKIELFSISTILETTTKMTSQSESVGGT